MFCRFCGKEIQDESSFCAYCGKNLSASAQPEEIPVPVTAPVQETEVPKEPIIVQQTPVQVHSGSLRNVVLGACLFAAVITVCVLFITKVLCFHVWEEATCIHPRTCINCERTQGERLGHNWSPATCTRPQTCLTCREVMGNARKHQWVGGICETPTHCALCHEVAADAPGHTWVEATEDTPRTCSDCMLMEALPMPENGKVFIGKGKYCGSQLTIHAANEAVYVKLKDADGTDVYSFLVRANETAVVSVPAGSHYVYFAHGTQWFGSQFLFGDETTYSKDDELLDFSSYTWEYTLTPVTDGNFSEIPIDQTEF